MLKAEHRIEECLDRAKSEAGLADYEVRTWRGWHHHQTLSLIATWFLTQEKRRGKKIHAGDHRPTDSPHCWLRRCIGNSTVTTPKSSPDKPPVACNETRSPILPLEKT